ncbi:hypothetical protein [Streptomyces sp. NPDC101178]
MTTDNGLTTGTPETPVTFIDVFETAADALVYDVVVELTAS